MLLLPRLTLADDLAPTALASRAVRFTYEAKVAAPEGAGALEVWLPLPRGDDQRILDLRLSGTGHPTVVRLEPSGDLVAYLRVTHPRGAIRLAETATVLRNEIATSPVGNRATVADVDPAVFATDLRTSPFILVNDDIRAIARKQTAGKKTVVAQARALYDWVYDHMQYDSRWPASDAGTFPTVSRREGELHRLPHALHGAGARERNPDSLEHGIPAGLRRRAHDAGDRPGGPRLPLLDGVLGAGRGLDPGRHL